jgi:hypothetical protein
MGNSSSSAVICCGTAAVLPGMTEMDADYFTDEDLLISVCAGLIVVDKEQSIVRFVRKWRTIKHAITCADSP